MEDLCDIECDYKVHGINCDLVEDLLGVVSHVLKEFPSERIWNLQLRLEEDPYNEDVFHNLLYSTMAWVELITD